MLGTIGGFGSSLFFVPIASYFLDFHSVLGITAIFHVSSNLSKIALFRKGIDKRLVVMMGIPAVIFVAIGAWLSQYMPTASLETGLAVFLVVVSTVFILFKDLKIKPTTLSAVSGGVSSGFIAGLLGTGGAIRGMVLAAFALEAQAFVATSAVIDLGIDLSRSIVYLMNGYVHSHDIYLLPVLLGVSVIGTWVGKLVLARVPQTRFRSFVLMLVLATGIATLVKAWYAQ